GGGVQSIGGNNDLEMRGVRVDVQTDHPLAPFHLTAPNMRSSADLMRYVAEGEDPVELIGEGLIAKGWNLTMDRASGQVDFIGGGDFKFQTEDGETMHFSTEKGTPLHVSHTEQGSAEQFQLRVLGGGKLALTGKNNWTVESRGLALQASRNLLGEFVLDRLDTTGTVKALRGNNLFSGSGVRLVRQEDGELLDLHIANNPKAELEFSEGAADDSKVEVRGSGPMIVHAENTEGSSEQAELELRGGGSIVFPSEEQPLKVTFRENLSLWVDRLHESGTFEARGHVHIEQGEAWLRTDALDSIVWSAEQRVVDVACEGKTTARMYDESHGNLDFSADQGALLQVQGELWSFPQASGVHTTRTGKTPLEIRAAELRDLNWATQTFRAWGQVVVQNPIGSVQCERIQALEGDRLNLFGSNERPAQIELISGLALAKDVVSGTLTAVELRLEPDQVMCIGQVETDLLTRQGRLRHHSERLTLNLDRFLDELSGFRIFSAGPTRFDWEVAEDERMVLECHDLHLNGQGPLETLTGPKGDVQGFNQNVFSVRAEDVTDLTRQAEGQTMTLQTKNLAIDGHVLVVEDERKSEVQLLRADGGFSYSESGERRFEASGKSLLFEGKDQSFHVEPHEGEVIVATGMMPQTSLPFRVSASKLMVSELRMEADNPELTVGLSILPVGEGGEQMGQDSLFRAGHVVVTPGSMDFSGGVFVKGTDLGGVPVVLQTEHLQLNGDLLAVADGQAALQSMEELRATDGFDLVYGGLARARGERLVVLPSSITLTGSSMKRVRVDLEDLYLETERLVANLDDFLITTDRGVMRGGETKREWSLEYASLQPIKRNGETMFAMASPTYSMGARTARSNWAMVWINAEAWRSRGRSVLWGEPV
ncbi:MAG: hypothetical protein P1V35_17815, partial [Planctomycetota bacterium]|nr:hypothetical protein [Planctomycetota bacterium]